MNTHKDNPEPVRSLIIDDEIDICYLLGNLLRRKHILNDYTTNLTEGMRLLNKKHFDFVLLDNFLPDGKGIDFIPYLKDHFPAIKIVMITACMEAGTDHKSFPSNAIDLFLPKPLNTDSFNHAIDQLLEKGADGGINN